VFEVVRAGGWVMWPILLCSTLALAIIVERMWALRPNSIMPAGLIPEIWKLHSENALDEAQIRRIQLDSPMGAILAAGLNNHRYGREVMKESLEQAGRSVIHDLGRYLDTLGTIASVSPYLGLLGSVLGMIKVFSQFSVENGITNPAHLAGGISEILVATASGLMLAIPSLMFYRYFRARIDSLAIRMEAECLRLVELIHGERAE
jgi:biopolymer transport protein ExbB